MALSRDEMVDRVWVYLDDATRKAYNEDEIDDDQLIQLGVKQGWIPADFSEVEGSASTVPVETPYWEQVGQRGSELRDDLGSVLDSLQGGLQSSAAGLTQFGADYGLSPTSAYDLPYTPEMAVQDLNASAIENRAVAAERLAQQDGLDWLALRTTQDIASSLPSLASLLSPATAPLAAGYVFGEEYNAARQGGVDPNEAALRATGQSLIEFATERLPVGRAADNLFPVMNDLFKVPARVAATGAAEAVSEGLTTQGQLLFDKVLSEVGTSEEQRTFARENLPGDITQWWEETSRSMLAGGGMGAAVGGPMQAMRVAAERGKLAGNLLNTLDAQADRDIRARLDRQPEQLELDDFDAGMEQELQRQASAFPEVTQDDGSFDPTLLEASNRALQDPGPAFAPFTPPPAAPVAPTVAPVAPAKPKRTRKTATQKKGEIKDNKTLIDGWMSKLGGPNLSQETDTTTTGVSMQDVGNAIVDKLGRGDAQVAARLLVNGNVRLVQSESDIPGYDPTKTTGSAGYYDGQQAYIVADHLAPENIMGELLNVAAHEVKHGGDLAADPTLRTTMGEFIGPEANARVNRQVETLAAEGNRVAQAAIDKANDTDNYELEVSTYLINEARNLRDKKNPVMRVVGDIVSAARVAAKRVMPGDYDININDVAYLSDQMLKKTAVQNPDLAENAPNFLQMVAGKRSASFARAQQDGRVYEGKDGKPKFWFSDADSSVLVDGWLAAALQRVTDNNTKGVVGNTLKMKLSDILQHETLYQEYPELKNVTINLTDGLTDGALGRYDADSNSITLDINLIPDDVIAETTMYDNPLHQILLHEVQHAVQDIEGFSGGTNPEEAATYIEGYTDVRETEKTAENTLATLAAYIVRAAKEGDTSSIAVGFRVPNEAAERMLQTAERFIGDRNLDQLPAPSRMRFMAGLGEQLTKILSASGTEDTPLGTYTWAANALPKARADKKKLVGQAFAKYMNNAGEAEARLTEQNIPVRDLARSNLSITRPTGEGDTARTANGRAEDGINPENIYGPDTWVEYRGANYSKATSLSMAINVIPHSTKVGNDPKAINKVWRTIKRMLAPSGGFPPELNEIRLHGSSLPASLSVHSTQLGDNFLTAIQENAKRLKVPETDLREKIGKRIDEIDNMENMDIRVSAVAALDREYPGVGKALNDLREYKLNLTRELIALRARDPKPFSKKEIAIYNKMVTNAERYTTRAYLATYNKELGQLYGKHFLKQAKADPDSVEGKKLGVALEYLANQELVIPPVDGLEAMKTKQLRRLHKVWVGNTARYKGKKGRAAMISNLSGLPARTQEMIDNKSMEIVRDLLGLNEKASSKIFSTPSMRQQRTIIEARTDLPEPLRALMGEITDPVLRETISLQRMINLVTKTKVLTELYEKGQAAGWWSDTRTDAHQRELNNISYGPLDGKWINQDVEDAITGTILSMENLDSSLAELMQKPDAVMQVMLGASFKPSREIMSAQKTTQVVMSPINMMMNFGGALLLMAPSQGLINPATYWKGMYNTAQVLGREISTDFGTPEKNAAAAELLLAGVTDSATMGEFRGEQFRIIHDEIKKMIANKTYSLPKTIQTVFSTLKGTPNALRQGYAFMDVWVKAATYYQRKDFLTEFNKVENKGWTEEQIIRRAGYEAAGTNISYERSVPLVRVLEQNIPFFMFLTYFSETFRATAMSYAQAYKDFNMASKATTPEGKKLAMKMGTSRLVGTTVMTIGVQQAIMWALDNEDEEEKKKRLLDAAYMEDKIIAPMGINKDGNEVMVELQRLDPIGPMNEFVVKLMRAPEGELAATAAQGVYDMFVESRGVISAGKILTDIAVHSAASVNEKAMEWDARRNKNTVLERNYPEAYEWIRSSFSAGDIGENMVTAVEEILLPTAIEPFIDAERTQVSEVREGDVQINGEPIHPMLRAFGYKAYVRDPHKSLTFRTMDYNDAIGRLRQETQDLNARADTMDPADLLEGLNSIRSQEKDLFDDMYNAYEGFMAFDNTKAKEFDEIIGNKTLASQLRRGKFESRLIDGEALDRWYEQAKKERGVDKQALRDQYRLLKKAYKGSNHAAE